MSAERVRVNQLVHTIFGPKFHIEMFVDALEDKTNICYKIKYPDKKKTSCLDFYFDDEFSHLYISWLSKCGSADDLRSGTLLLNMVDALAGLIPECKTITLEDASTVSRCSYKINLAELTILLTGISWYNRFGYKQQSYESDKEHNHRVINMPISDAVTKLLPSPVLKQFYPKFEEYKQDLDTRLKIVNSPDLTVSKYIKILYDFIKSYPEDKDQCVQHIELNARYVRYVINAFGILLTYDELATRGRFNSILTKQVVHRCGECDRVLRGDDLPPWKAEPKGAKYYTTRGEGEHEELICHKCATEEASRSQKAMSPRAMSAPGGGARKSRTTRRKPMRRTRRRPMRRTKQMI